MLNGRHIAIAVVLGIAVVFGLAGWRQLKGENQWLTSAKPVADAVAVETATALNQLEGSQRALVDDVQLLQERASAQEAEIKRLKDELEALSQRFEALTSFGSTAKERAPTVVVEPKQEMKPPARRTR